MPSYIVRNSGPYNVFGAPIVTIPQAHPSTLNYSLGASNDYLDNVPSEGAVDSFSIDGSNVTTIHIKRTGPFYIPATFLDLDTVILNSVPAPYDYLNGVHFTVSTAVDDSPATKGFTITCTGLTHVTVPTTPITGAAVQSGAYDDTEYSEPLTGTVSVPQTGLQFALPAYVGQQNNSPAITWEVEYPVPPATVTAHLQGAIRDEDGEYVNLDSSTKSTGELRTVSLGQVRVKFLRIQVVATTGSLGQPTVIGKITI